MTFAESMSHPLLAAAISATIFAVGLVRRRACWSWRVGGLVGAAMTCFVADAELRGYRSDVSEPALVAAILVGLVVAVGLIVVGLRGRRVGDHPYCRRCGFDLIGRPADSTACAECGTALFAPDAIVVGVRHRRVGPLLAGVLALLLSLAGIATFARDTIGWAEQYRWRKHWPEAWLVSDLRATREPARGEAEYELYQRLQHQTIGSQATAALIDDAMKRPPGLWMDVLGAEGGAHLARDRWIAGTIDEATVRRAMRATIDLQLAVSPMAAPGHVLRYEITSPDDSLSLATTLSIERRLDSLDGRQLPAPTTSTLDPGRGIASLGDCFAIDTATPLGPATLVTQFTATITLVTPGRPTLVESRDLTLRASTRLVEPAFMTCPPIALTSTFASPSLLEPQMADLRSTSEPRADGDGGTLRLTNRSAVPILCNATLLCYRASRPLGPVYLHEGRDVELTVADAPTLPYTVVFEPAPDLGVELFRVVPMCRTTMKVSAWSFTPP